jgi:hypothetical protein
MTRYKRGEHPPRRAAFWARAHVTNDVDPHRALFPREDAVQMIVDMKPAPTATSARRWPISVGRQDPSLMLRQLVHIRHDDGAAVEALPARVDQAGLRRRWVYSGIQATSRNCRRPNDRTARARRVGVEPIGTAGRELRPTRLTWVNERGQEKGSKQTNGGDC